MAATDSRICPLASLRLYDPGQGDPVVTDRGFGWYDVLAHSAGYGTIQRDSAGELLLEYLEGVGLVCRPYLKLQDTREARWSFGVDGTWAERLPATGSPRKYRLVQLDTTADIEWDATLDHDLPKNPSVAFSLMFVDTPPDHDADTYPPYVRIELGEDSQQFALEFSKIYGGRLLAYDTATAAWVAVRDLPQPQQLGNVDLGETLVILRVLRDQLCISVDYGRSYVFYPLPRDASGTAIPLKPGPAIVRGQGGMLAFGMHQIRYYTGYYISPVRNTLTERTALSSATVTGVHYRPPGTTATYSDQSTPESAYAKWKVILTPKSKATSSFLFYSTPEVYAVKFTYPVVRTLPAWTYTTPWDGVANSPFGITAIDIEKPYELDGGKATVTVRLNPDTQFSGNLRWRKVAIDLGEVDDDGVTTRTTGGFTGYVALPSTSADGYKHQYLRLQLVTIAERLKRQQWTDFDSLPLGGQTVNQALDAILATEGFDDFPALFAFPYSYRSWHAVGDNLTLPAGTPENPFEWPRRGESKWETMVRIAGYAGLEIAVLDDGTLSSGPQKYVDLFVSYAVTPTPDTNLTLLVKRAALAADYRESVTAVLVQGIDATTGGARYAYGVDAFAESFALSDRFCPWRETIQEEVPFPCNGLVLAARAQALAVEGFPVKYEPDITLPVNLLVRRRMRVQIQDLTIGIADWHEFAVLTLKHTYRADDPGFAQMDTVAGLRRVWP